MSPSLDVVSSATRLDFGLNPRGAGSNFGLITLLVGSGSAAISNTIIMFNFSLIDKRF